MIVMCAFRSLKITGKRTWANGRKSQFAPTQSSPTSMVNTTSSLGITARRLLSLKAKSSPIDRFGIIAAMSRDGVIGINGDIPWKIPLDRKLFKQITDKRIIIVGKRTFAEHPKLAHINHTRHCIVVSTSMKTIDANPKDAPETSIQLARSFPEALAIARDLEFGGLDNKTAVRDGPNCWVAGGEQLYKEALQHDSAVELHLSVVDVEIDKGARGDIGYVSMFPSRSLWADQYKEWTKVEYPRDLDAPSFTYYVYRQKRNGSCS